MKLITVVTPCFNEEQNIEEIYRQVKAVFNEIPDYQYEHVFIDNASTDNTVEILRALAKTDKALKIIVNARNFGPVRSPFYGMLQAQGDAVIHIVADLQDPPTMIKDFIAKWEQGYKIVVGVKSESHESPLFFFLRKSYYKFISKIADVKLIKNFTGFGLFDKVVIETLRKLDEPYPYFRGLISELGYKIAELPYKQPVRIRGCSKANFYTLYDWAMLGITSHSKVPLRLATMAGFLLSMLSFLMAVIFILLKLIFWKSFGQGIAPILVGLFFFSSIQLFFIGLLGEYIAAINTRIMKRPLVIEDERVNFH